MSTAYLWLHVLDRGPEHQLKSRNDASGATILSF